MEKFNDKDLELIERSFATMSQVINEFAGTFAVLHETLEKYNHAIQQISQRQKELVEVNYNLQAELEECRYILSTLEGRIDTSETKKGFRNFLTNLWNRVVSIFLLKN